MFPRVIGLAFGLANGSMIGILRIPFFVVGLLMVAVATGLYIGARLGPGPRDGLMTGLHARSGWPIWLVRTMVVDLI